MLAWSVLPPGSVAVTTTELVPISAQVNVAERSYDIATWPEQLSVAEPSVKVASPLASRTRVTSLAVIAGAKLSTTVTVMFCVEELVEASVAVTVTVTVPTSSQSNVD
jgi:hypothetical protein